MLPPSEAAFCPVDTRRSMMSEPQRKTSRSWEPPRYRQDAQSPDAKLPEGDGVFFLLDLVPQLDVRRFYAPYEEKTRGAPPFDPAMMVCLLLSASCGGGSSRKMAQACERTLALVAMGGADRPDCRTISDFRQVHVEACKDVWGQVRRVAGAAGLVQLGHVATDGTTMQGNAARHTAMSDGSMRQEADRLRADIAALVTQAHPQAAEDEAAWGRQRGAARPAEWARRADRLATIEAAMRRLEARAQAEADAERQRRAEVEAARQRLGSPRRGKAPKPVDETPDDTAQTNVTGPELHSRRTNTKGWEYCGNAQASGDAAHPIIVACDVTAASNDKQQAAPLAPLTGASLAQAGRAPPTDATGAIQKMPATSESGSDRAGAAAAVEHLGGDPYLATERPRHHGLETESPARLATAQERLAATGRTPAGRAVYARRQGIVEPVCGQSKEGRGVRRFLLRGLASICGEWRLVCVTHHLLTIWRYACAPLTV
jgi:transposase